MNKGTVKFYNEAKGYGFIVDKDSQEEIYVQSSALKEIIREKDSVEFEITKGEKGLIATNVSII